MCHPISKDGRICIEGNSSNKSSAIMFATPRQKDRMSCEKEVTIFLLLMWILSWGWSRLVGGVLFLYTFDLIWFDFVYLSCLSIRCQLVSVDWRYVCFGSNFLRNRHQNSWKTDSVLPCTWQADDATEEVGLWYLHFPLCVPTLLLRIYHLSNSFRTHLFLLCHHIFTHPVRAGACSISTVSLMPSLDHSIALCINCFSTFSPLFISPCPILQLALRWGQMWCLLSLLHHAIGDIREFKSDTSRPFLPQ